MEFPNLTAAVRLAQNPDFHRRTKHITIKHFFIREKFTEGLINIKYVSTQKQLFDLLTKPLHEERMKLFCIEIGLI